MAERLVLHIGVQKSGTTYLQRMLQDRARELAEIGVLYPVPGGRRGASTRVNHHELATYGLLGTEYSWVSGERAAKERAWWEKLRTRVHEWPGTAIVSAEALSVVRSDAARQTVEALGPPGKTDVLITARGLGKLLPSCWQQWLRNGRGTTFDGFMRRFAHERDKGWDVLEQEPQADKWRAFAIARLARRWAAVVRPERVTVISNPGSPADRLWWRFLDAAGLGDASGVPAPDPGTTIHSGMTAAEAQVIRSTNASLLSAGWPPDTVRRLAKRTIRELTARDQRGPRLGVPASYREQVDRWSREDVADLRRSELRIVGDVDELDYAPDSEPPEPTAADVAEAAGVATRVAAGWAPGPKDVLPGE